MTSSITRRDFVNGILIGSGASLLSASAPAATSPIQSRGPYAPSGSPWTGYGGVGDYCWSNGNTEAITNAAHGIRDHSYPDAPTRIDEAYDLVIIGGGFSGVSAAYEFSKHRAAGQTCLLLENHPVIGGEAKQNEFDVDGQRLTAPQGSNAGLVINRTYVKGSYGAGRYDTYAEYWQELGLPEHFELEALAGGAEKYNLPNDHFDPMYLESRFATGYYFGDRGWVRNPVANNFRDTPWSAEARRDIDDFVNNRRDVISGVNDLDRWLDTISYYQLLDKLGYGPEVRQYVDPLIGVGNFGVCGNAISAFAARRLTLPGTIPSDEKSRFTKREVISFPGGNAAILRTMLKRILPDAIHGNADSPVVVAGAMNLAAFDRPKNPIRIRLDSTVIRVEHEGDPSSTGSVLVAYVQNGRVHKVRAKAVVVGCGGWVARNIVADLPASYADAYRNFRYGPVLTANVAVRNWRFFDKLGFTVARWFAGLGWHVCVRRNVALDKNQRPLTPDSPVVLTFYIPFLHPKEDPAVQGALGRAQLLATSYSDFEQQIRTQLSEMFSAAGFDARRDIAGIILNRWGHAYFAPPVGFFHGVGERAAAPDVLRRPHGRIVFAHSELQGNMNMAHAMMEGKRGALQALPML